MLKNTDASVKDLFDAESLKFVINYRCNGFHLTPKWIEKLNGPNAGALKKSMFSFLVRSRNFEKALEFLPGILQKRDSVFQERRMFQNGHFCAILAERNAE